MNEKWPPIAEIIDQAIGCDSRIDRRRLIRPSSPDGYHEVVDSPVRRMEPKVNAVPPGQDSWSYCPCSFEQPLARIVDIPPRQKVWIVEMRHQCYANTVRGETERLDVWVGQCPGCKTIWWEAKP